MHIHQADQPIQVAPLGGLHVPKGKIDRGHPRSQKAVITVVVGG
jgi:hypothetical protein